MAYWVVTQDNWWGVTTVDPYPASFPATTTIFDMEGSPPDIVEYEWDLLTSTFMRAQANKLSRVDFILRWSAQEWGAATSSVDNNIKQGLALIQAAEYVDVSDIRTRSLVAYCAMIGLIPEARVAEILA